MIWLRFGYGFLASSYSPSIMRAFLAVTSMLISWWRVQYSRVEISRKSMVYSGKETKKKETETMPHPRAIPLKMSEQQKDVLQRVVHRATCSQRLLRRGAIILAAQTGATTTRITRTCMSIRKRCDCGGNAGAQPRPVCRPETATGKPKRLRQASESLLTDEQRPATPGHFTLEQCMQIMALAYEMPAEAERPVSNWTPCELADEAIKRGMVTQISLRTVGRFLTGERFTAAPPALLADSLPRPLIPSH